MYMPHIKFQDSSISGSRVSQLPSIMDRQTDGQTDGRTDRPKPICPLNFSKVGGIKTVRSEALSSSCQFFRLQQSIGAMVSLSVQTDSQHKSISSCSYQVYIIIRFLLRRSFRVNLENLYQFNFIVRGDNNV